MKRREFITLLGGGAGVMWPLSARAQQRAMPMIGFVHTAPAAPSATYVAAFRQGLSAASATEGQNVMVEYRWAEGYYDRLPGIVAEFVRREVAVIVACGGMAPALVAKAATPTIPIVFVSGDDPVSAGLIPNLNRPGGNITGVVFFNSALAAKRIELVRELFPGAITVAYMANPNRLEAEHETKNVQDAARSLGLQLQVLHAASEADIDVAFDKLAQLRPRALLVAAEAFLGSQRARTTAHAARLAIPVIGTSREYVTSGALVSYGTSITDAYQQAGLYVGRILKGERPADLPVTQPTRFDLAINLKTAKTLGITVPPTLLARADEVIE